MVRSAVPALVESEGLERQAHVAGLDLECPHRVSQGEGVEQGEIVGELSVQEAGGIGALGTDHAPVGQGRSAFESRGGRRHAPIIISPP